MGKMKRMALSGVNQDIHSVIQTDDDVFAMHEAVEQFDPKTEISFQYLQVFSAICVSFAHGANDVANAAGPLSGIYAVYEVSTTYRKKMVKEAEVPVWVLIIGAVGLVIGLGTYGYNIMRALGVRMAAMTPSRGYSAELSTSLVISIASAYGMPISTTHTITGAVVGVGLMEGRKGVNWKHLAKTFTSWVFTLIFVGFISAALFSQGAYAPSVQGNREVQSLAKTLNGVVNASDGKPGLAACIKIFGEAKDSTTGIKNGKCNI
jgi:sodium-dependent phosphate transporter